MDSWFESSSSDSERDDLQEKSEFSSVLLEMKLHNFKSFCGEHEIKLETAGPVW